MRDQTSEHIEEQAGSHAVRFSTSIGHVQRTSGDMKTFVSKYADMGCDQISNFLMKSDRSCFQPNKERFSVCSLLPSGGSSPEVVGG